MGQQDEILRSLVDEAYSQPSEDIAAYILRNAGIDPGELKKTITTGTGLVAFDLQAPAKNLYPFNTPIRNRIPRVGGGVGTATNWRQVNAIIGSGYDNTAWIPEGQRAGQMSYNTSNKLRILRYARRGRCGHLRGDLCGPGLRRRARPHDDAPAAKDFPQGRDGDPGGNNFDAAWHPSGRPSRRLLPARPLPLHRPPIRCIVVALTNEGFQNSQPCGRRRDFDDRHRRGWQDLLLERRVFDEVRGGGRRCACTSGTNKLGATVTPVVGAVAYAWYIGTTGAETLQQITTTNSAVILYATRCGPPERYGGHGGLLDQLDGLRWSYDHGLQGGQQRLHQDACHRQPPASAPP